jgi:hypothetical protein
MATSNQCRSSSARQRYGAAESGQGQGRRQVFFTEQIKAVYEGKMCHAQEDWLFAPSPPG